MRQGRHTFDYIVIGAGSAGCVLANRLSEDPANRVAVLEAGPPDRDLMIHIPAGVYKVFNDPDLNWNDRSQPEPALQDRSIDTPRGKVVGGSSSINAMVYMRGHPLDYDRWADDFGLPDWSYAHCLPYFKQGETCDRGADDWRGGGGRLHVSRGTLDNPLYDAFLAAGEAAGQGRSDDLNGFNPEGVARLDSTKKNGRRCSAAVAHLRPALSRPNLTLLTRAHVRRLTLDRDRVTGVEYERAGERHCMEAERGVALCGGAINSPQLLMLSGLGPADHLRAHGIALHRDLPGVGSNLQDHATLVMQFACTRPVTIDPVGRPLGKAMAGLQWLVSRSGVAASNIWEAGGLVRSNPQVAYPNLQYHFGPVGFDHVDGRIRLNQAFSIHIDQLRPTSRGTITLASADPRVRPLIRFNYLAAGHDRREMVEGVRLVRDLVGQRPFDPFRGAEIRPGAGARTDAEIETALGALVETDYHPCGTCRMGGDALAVVDGGMRVRGVDNLYVVDASVLPRILSANLNGPVQMLADRAADAILGREPLPPFHARFAFQHRHSTG